MKAKMFIPVLVTAAVFFGSTGLANHSTDAYAQDNPLGDIPVIGDLMGGNQSQQNQSQQNQSQQNQSQQNQSGNPLSDVPVIGELVP